ncbi:MAG: hypothetical protein HY080_16790 [Gammaproteobacteria bacterium]|nr:hypothetical protein [Gammaproteobacteria bacterium]
MTQISIWVLLVIEQTAIVAVLLALVYFMQTRKLKRRLAEFTAGNAPLKPAVQQNTALPVTVDRNTLIEVGELREKLSIAEQRIKNLERFRDLFFDIKDKLGTMLTTQGNVSAQVQQLQLSDTDSAELKRALEKLAKEKEALEQHLKQVEIELDLLMDNRRDHPDANAVDINATSIIQQQQEEIGKLIQAVADLEVEAAMLQRVQKSLNLINASADELSTAIDVLQDENQFLTEQIQSLLKEQMESDNRYLQEIHDLKQQTAALESRHMELEKKHTKLETEYLKLQK